MPEHQNERIPVSVVILTLNEAVNIERCLDGVAAFDEVIIVDSGSTDGTQEVAKSARPDAQLLHHPFKDFGDQRNWAIDNASARNRWLLFVDADEFCTPEVIEEIRSFVQMPGDKVGAFIAGKNYFLGRWLKHATLYPSYQMRLIRNDDVRFVKEGHGQREVTNGPVHYLKNGWRHEALSKGLDQWCDRHNRYSSEEADLQTELRKQPLQPLEVFARDPIRRRRALKRLAARLPARPVLVFIYFYLIRGGFLDGYPGLVYCSMIFGYQINIRAKEAERDFAARRD